LSGDDLSATGAENVTIRDAAPGDAVAASAVLRESISRLCVADHGNDPAILNAWLANKQPETVAAWVVQKGNSPSRAMPSSEWDP
jgi:hypothetical protein